MIALALTLMQRIGALMVLWGVLAIAGGIALGRYFDHQDRGGRR